MLILIGPAKTFSNNKFKTTNKHKFIKETDYLINELKTLSTDDLKKKMKLTDKLAETTYNYYQNINNASYEAINLYYGQVFKQIDYLTLNNEEKTYINEHVKIISALYGILNPLDGINNYRLDFTNNFITNLYKYWEDYFNNYFKDKLLISLLSNEFLKIIPKTNLININFTTSKSMELKTLRGRFLRALAINNVKDIDDIKKISVDGYTYSATLSNSNNLVFTKA